MFIYRILHLSICIKKTFKNQLHFKVEHCRIPVAMIYRRSFYICLSVISVKELNFMSQQAISIIVFVVVFIAIMSEKVHRAVAAVAGVVALIMLGILTIDSAV